MAEDWSALGVKIGYKIRTLGMPFCVPPTVPPTPTALVNFEIKRAALSGGRR
jgi:hypothetical protein